MEPKQTTADIFRRLVTSEEQSAFLAGMTLTDDGPLPPPSSDERLVEFHELDRGGEILAAIRAYVAQVIPKARASYEAGLWAISCLPSTGGGERMFTFNCPGLQTLLGGDQEGGWLRMNLSSEMLPPDRWPAVRTAHGLPETALGKAAHKRPATFVDCGIKSFRELLGDGEILRAARAMVLECIESGGQVWARTASTALAAEVLGSFADFTAAEPGGEVAKTASPLGDSARPDVATDEVLEEGQGYEADPATRTAIEQRAIAVCRRMLQDAGYEVIDRQQEKLGFDLEGRRDERVIKVEVKGTRGSFKRMIFTRREVEHAQDKNKGSVLVVVWGITLNDGVGVGGQVRVWQPWNPSDESLQVRQYVCSLDGATSIDHITS